MAWVGFPLENTEYSAEEAQAWHSGRSTGSYALNDDFAVTPAGGMTVQMAPGRGQLTYDASRYRTVTVFSDEPTLITLNVADNNYDRIDRVGFGYDRIANIIREYYVPGVPSANPVPPAIMRNEDTYLAYCGEITVKRGVDEITSANIDDLRMNEELCGIVRDELERIPTQVIQDKVLAMADELQEVIDGVIDGSQYMLTTRYDPRGAVAAADGIDGYVASEITAGLATITDGWIVYQAQNPNPSVYTTHNIIVKFNPALNELSISGAINKNSNLVNGDVLFNISNMPGIVIPTELISVYNAGAVTDQYYGNLGVFACHFQINGDVTFQSIGVLTNPRLPRFTFLVITAGWS